MTGPPSPQHGDARAEEKNGSEIVQQVGGAAAGQAKVFAQYSGPPRNQPGNAPAAGRQQRCTAETSNARNEHDRGECQAEQGDKEHGENQLAMK